MGQKGKTMKLRYNRKQYMDREQPEVTHQVYYEQFATPEVIALVKRHIGVDRIKASTDEWFNDIPLGRWDAISGYPGDVIAALNASNASTTREGRGWHSMSDLVCIVKAAARMIKEDRA
jgi:spermidine/putrescine-binding protein